MPDRRTLLRGAGAAGLALNFGGWLATPREAWAAGYEPSVLTDQEFKLTVALGEALVPGAAAAGIAPYLDQQLGAARSETLLMIQYLGVEAPYLDFYRAGLAAVEGLAQQSQGRPFADLSADRQTATLGSFAGAQPEGWEGPPSPFFYFVFRSDATDVVYGTPEGFSDLGTPYSAHIVPPDEPWRSGTQQ